jgi:hypothetical protein
MTEKNETNNPAEEINPFKVKQVDLEKFKVRREQKELNDKKAKLIAALDGLEVEQGFEIEATYMTHNAVREVVTKWNRRHSTAETGKKSIRLLVTAEDKDGKATKMELARVN